MLAPKANQRTVVRTIHDETFQDDFAWLRDRDDPAVLEYLQEENAFVEEATAHLAPLREEIFGEIKSKVQETDLSAPARRGKWWYGRRTEEGKQYPAYIRWWEAPEGDGEIVLDQNQLAEGQDFCDIGVLKVSPDQTLLAYSVDHTGNEDFNLRFRHLDTGEEFPESLTKTYYGGAWSAKGDYFFYSTIDAAHRPYRLWRHRLGTEQSEDVLVFDEADERFYLFAGPTRDERYVLIHVESSTTSEISVVATADPEAEARVLIPRVAGTRYQAEHKDDRWLIVTDDGAPNGKLLSFPVDDLSADAAEELIGHYPDVKVARVLPFARHLVVTGRKRGLPSVSVMWADGKAFDVGFEEPSYSLGIGENLEYDSPLLRVEYESFLTPRRVIDVDLDNAHLTVVKETVVPGDYQPDRYIQQRIWARAADGTEIPISLVHRKGLDLPAPTMLYGYGAYESVIDPWFSPGRFSLLDRGVVYAVAHVRGGGEMGRLWHEQGRMANKQNSFDDFIDVADHLIDERITEPGRIAARGVSAGGLLMGAVTTKRPDLWAVVIAEVPFVDAINTMLDPTIPLTIGECEEWGDPSIPEQFNWMLAYSPYENTVAAAYPAILATAGFHDPRVAYWEPAKWVARLRTVNEGGRPILLKTELGAGHSGPSGRYDNWREQAFVLAFILDQLGLIPDPRNA